MDSTSLKSVKISPAREVSRFSDQFQVNQTFDKPKDSWSRKILLRRIKIVSLVGLEHLQARNYSLIQFHNRKPFLKMGVSHMKKQDKWGILITSIPNYWKPGFFITKTMKKTLHWILVGAKKFQM